MLSSGRGGGAILFADLDGFKTVNGRWGHAGGDALLVEVGRRLRGSVRDVDCVARTGGDEFAVAMRDVTAEEAAAAASRIRDACAAPFHLNGTSVTIGISVGVAHQDTDLGEATLDAADRDKYADKRRRASLHPPGMS
ncbi:MAG: GGDEF domain-containing protein [Acidimicrobiales bacterium]